MIYENSPKDFNPKFEVVSCFLERDKRIALLHRQDNKPEGNTWGAPAGKVKEGENILEAMIREFKEETRLEKDQSHFSYFDKVYVRFQEYDFIYHMFHIELAPEEEVIINYDEHKACRWVTPEDSLKLPLIQDQGSCIKLFYKI
ncbi:NUDIX hydrolase [Methanococcoides sp. SA1]|nr:NUDIX hydrolase [Methanococcoides sp. SA1]